MKIFIFEGTVLIYNQGFSENQSTVRQKHLHHWIRKVLKPLFEKKVCEKILRNEGDTTE